MFWDDHELDKSCLHLTLVFALCKTKQINLIPDHSIVTLDLNQNLIIIVCLNLEYDVFPKILNAYMDHAMYEKL